MIKRREVYEDFEEDHTMGFYYQRMFTQFINRATVDFVILEPDPITG